VGEERSGNFELEKRRDGEYLLEPWVKQTQLGSLLKQGEEQVPLEAVKGKVH